MKPARTGNRHPAREPWVWLVMGIPLATVVAGLATLWIAFQRADSNVTDDYYKEGLAINRKIERDQQASGYRLAAQMRVSAPPRAPAAGPLALNLELTGAPQAFEPEVTLRMTHPVQQSLDRQVVLQGVGGGRYEAQLADGGAPGTRWILALETPLWRLAIPGLQSLTAGSRLAADSTAPSAAPR